MYQKKYCEVKHVDLLLIGEGEKKYYVLIKDFRKFMSDHTIHHGRKHFLPLLFGSFLNSRKIEMSS